MRKTSPGNLRAENCCVGGKKLKVRHLEFASIRADRSRGKIFLCADPGNSTPGGGQHRNILQAVRIGVLNCGCSALAKMNCVLPERYA